MKVVPPFRYLVGQFASLMMLSSTMGVAPFQFLAGNRRNNPLDVGRR